MNRWPRYFGYLVFLLVWLFLISLPACAFVLATRGQIDLGSTESQYLRIFLVQEKDAEGLGVEWTRPASSQTQCLQTSVRYYLWTGQAQNVIFCQCIDPSKNAVLPAISGPCQAPKP